MTGPSTRHERERLLTVKRVGPTVITRLEHMGVSTLAALARRDAEDICLEGAGLVASTCWKNSPQARKAVAAEIDAAKSYANVKA